VSLACEQSEGGGKEPVTARSRREELPKEQRSMCSANMTNREPLGADGTGGGGYDAFISGANVKIAGCIAIVMNTPLPKKLAVIEHRKVSGFMLA